jgi:hypothetical protein
MGVLVAAAALLTTPASAGLFEDLYQGLDILATPTGFPVSVGSAGGLVNGNRFGRLRIVPNELGDGYRLELDRTFGADTRGRPEVFDLGNFELELSGPTQATLGFTRRGILTGNADVFANNLGYSLRGKSGGQDIELTGRLRVNNQLEVNQLGFYTLTLEVNNTDSALIADGVLVEGDRDTDFDVGPISIRGNIFYDVAAAVLTTFGVNTNDMESIFPASPIDRINDEIEAYLSRETEVLGDLIRADLGTGELSAAAALEARDFVGGLIRTADDAGALGTGGDSARVPEPASLLLLALGVVALRRWA